MKTAPRILLAAGALTALAACAEPGVCEKPFVNVTVLAENDPTAGVCDAECSLAEAVSLLSQCENPPLVRRDAALGGDVRWLRLLPDGALRIEPRFP
ncbi:MAG: hypothetical protein K8I02_06375 [Candidatus Methylomirabilis sp.]|nr:hypothetical protein [Deltaproteobacteria bacterium]